MEVMLFGDQVHQSMSISHGVIYNIEGARVPRHGSEASVGQVQKPYQWGIVPRRARRNWLAAYDANTGKAKWHRSAADSDKDDSDVGFLAAPVPYGNLLLLPVTDGGAIWLYGLSRLDGKTVWKSYLCDEPSGGCSPWSPVGVSVDGRDAYVLCGAGVVFSVDAVSGQIRFAIRYRRDGKDNQMMRMGYQACARPERLERRRGDFGRALVLLPTTTDFRHRPQRREFLWRSPRARTISAPPVTASVHGNALYVAGKTWCGGTTSRASSLAPANRRLARPGHPDRRRRYADRQHDCRWLEERPGRADCNRSTCRSRVGTPWATLATRNFSSGESLYALTDLETRLTVLARRIADGDRGYLTACSCDTHCRYESAVADMLRARRRRKQGRSKRPTFLVRCSKPV
jgi:hypothetical protein